MSLETFFNPKSVAIVGASHTKGKIGYVVFTNFLSGLFNGKVYPVNKNTEPILGQKVYDSVLSIPGNVDLAVIVIPGKFVQGVLSDCVKKGVKSVIIISSGFSEMGEEGKKLEDELKKTIRATRTRVIGTNCLGVYDSSSQVDTLFLSRKRCGRPKQGNIAFISQSGAVGSTILDWLSEEDIGMSKFISYGNGMDVDESDLIEYLGNDTRTRVITAYIEGLKGSGKKFMEVCRRVSRKKPIIVLKAGKTKKGTEAVSSHTGSLAGSGRIYSAAFKQSGVIEADTWQELFDYARAFSTQPIPRGDRIVIVTDGGGFGVLATDEAERSKLKLPEPSQKLKQRIKHVMPPYAILHNPIDLTGDADAERYRVTIEECLRSNEYDGVIAITLFQVPTLEEKVVDYLIELKKKYKKPILACAAGGEYSNKLSKKLTKGGIPVYPTPERTVKVMKALVEYGKR
ncbi:MAG: CoA-binding protein [Candidatus Aenigmarchaeota archaeon]|nr:CoA-binding protein [Candidatus Aenigmarchaeota archaeon]